MTVLAYALLIATALVCAGAARRIAIAKGRTDSSNFALAGLLLGPIGLAWAAFARSPEAGEDRLVWWSSSSVARTWVGLALLLIAGSIGVGAYQTTRPPTFDGNSLEPQIEQWLAAHDAPGATVDCPDSYSGKSGATFLCTASDGTGSAHVQVTVLNDKGEVNWTVIG